jgi:hypothetical protein
MAVCRPRLDRVGRQPRRRELSEDAGVEDMRRRPGETGPLVLALQHRQVEADVVADHHPLTDEGVQPVGDLGEARGPRQLRLADTVDGRRAGRHRHARIDQGFEPFGLLQQAAAQSDGADLDDACPLRIEAGRLGVEDHRIHRKERRGTCRPAGPRHRADLPARNSPRPQQDAALRGAGR